MESKYAIDLKPAGLRFEIPSGERIPNGYTLLDLVFVAATSPDRRRNWADTKKKNPKGDFGICTKAHTTECDWSEPLVSEDLRLTYGF